MKTSPAFSPIAMPRPPRPSAPLAVVHPPAVLIGAALALGLSVCLGPSGMDAQETADVPFRAETPVRQSDLTLETAGPPRPLTLRDASRDDRWLGLEVRDVRWAPDGARVYFRWHPAPSRDRIRMPIRGSR